MYNYYHQDDHVAHHSHQEDEEVAEVHDGLHHRQEDVGLVLVTQSKYQGWSVWWYRAAECLLLGQDGHICNLAGNSDTHYQRYNRRFAKIYRRKLQHIQHTKHWFSCYIQNLSTLSWKKSEILVDQVFFCWAWTFWA